MVICNSVSACNSSRASKNFATLLVALSLSFLAFISSANALTLDDFLSDNGVFATSSLKDDRLHVPSPSAIGGGRTLRAQHVTGPRRVFVDTFGGDFSFSAEAETAGIGEVNWDGNSDKTTIVQTGLGGIDFTQDFNPGDVKQIVISVVSNDLQSPQASVELQVHDIFGNNATITKPVGKVTPIQGFPVIDLAFNFSEFVGVNFTKVGALRLRITDQTADRDIVLSAIKTNGICTAVPGADGKVIDDCGVCKEAPGYNQSKDDCGVCFGGNVAKDDCGVCFGGNTAKDSCGICYGNNMNQDSCGVCFGNNAAKDSCGVCFGNNVSLDSCGVCGGNNLSKDSCGICGGNGTSCLDCKGIPFGTSALDICGICGGNGTTCLDCKGIPYGTNVLDTCGVCGGDGKSCGGPEIKCVKVQATSDILTFEKRLITQAKTLKKRFSDDVSRAKAKKCNINIKSLNARVKDAYETIDQKGEDIFTKGVEVCGDSCVTVSFADQVQALSPTFKVLENSSKTLASKVKSCFKKKKIKSVNGGIGVTQTISNVKTELNQLIKDCKDKKVCAPGK